MFTVAQTSDGNVTVKATGDSIANGAVRVEFAPGVDAEIGQGADGVTYIALRDDTGALAYLSVAEGALVVGDTKP